ncbi:DUF6560 family protein [Candidatus Enterococcus ferrettii]|uniref:DUF304 domain-containing protein n=1 Tax=Candidatus Enterococcus ferrettii TaxID=2815324 RepID=A0ABV0EXV4_9ENTE
MGLVVFVCLFFIFICFPEIVKVVMHHRETKLKKSIIKARSAKKVSSHFIVQESKSVKLLLFVFVLFGSILFWGLLIQEGISSTMTLIWALILLNGVFYMIVYCHIRRVTVCDQEISYRSILKKTTFLFEEITKVRFGMNLTLIIYCENERMFAIETNCEGYYELLTRLIFEGVYFENLPKR